MTLAIPDHAERTADLIDRLGRLSRELCFEAGLNPAQWQALRYLGRANRASRTPSALARFLGTTKGTASQTLISLENKGYLRRVRGGPDRRKVRLDLTPDGDALLAEDPIGGIEKAAAELPADECTRLVRGLSRLLDDLRSRNGGREFGVCKTCGLFRRNQDSLGCGLQCGLTGQPIEPAGEDRICLNHRSRNCRS